MLHFYVTLHYYFSDKIKNEKEKLIYFSHQSKFGENMINEILSTVEDFEEKIEDGTIKVCMLRPYSKISIKGWYGFTKLYELLYPENAENNIGISLSGQETPGDPILTCIDIDGDKRTINDISVEQFSKDWMFKILIQKLKENNIDFMAAQSSSGGYHIYLYVTSMSNRYLSTRDLTYPKSLDDAALNDDIEMFLSANHSTAEQVYGDTVPHSIVEVWCDKRYMVAPGSTIYNEESNTYSTVKLLDVGVKKFGDIGIFEGNLNAIIREALVSAGFQEQESGKDYSSLKQLKRGYHPTDLSPKAVQMTGDLLLEWLPRIDGQKHTFCLALSGFLYNKQISLKSIQDIGYYVTQRSGTLFRSNSDFIDTLTHDTRQQDKTRLQTGLPSMEEILSNFYSKEYIGKKLHLILNPGRHRFWPEGRYASQYHEILLDFNAHYMLRNKIRVKINSNGEVSESVASTHKVLNNIDYLEYIDDLSEMNDLTDWEKPIRVTFTNTRGQQFQHNFDDSQDLINNYTKIPGSHGDSSKLIMESILNEFENLDLITHVESCTRPGLWLSPTKNKIVRYVDSKDGVAHDDPKMPAKKDLISALSILKRISRHLPWKQGKFATLVRYGLTMPYTQILKYNFNSQHPSMLLYGESGALKSTMAAMSVFLHYDHSKYDGYIVTGAEMNSEYRFGDNMDKNTFPVVVDEPEQLFYSTNMRELIKAAAFNKMIRKPGGKNSRPYYSRRGSIYTMNALPNSADNPEYLRRFTLIEFTIEERSDIPEVLENLEFLNTDGIENNRFKELHYIGDFVFNILNKHLNWFTQSIEEIQSNLLDAIEDHTGYDLDFLREEMEVTEVSDRSDHAVGTLNSILKVLRRPYLYSRSKYVSKKDSIITLKSIIKDNPEYSYVHFVRQKNDDDQYILIDIGFKEAYNSFYFNEGKTITLNNVLFYLKELDIEFDCLKMTPCYVEGRKKQVRGIKMSLNDFMRILIGKQELDYS